MERHELTEALTEFESKRPVFDWSWRGWRVWPTVRTRVALALHGDGGAGAGPADGRASALARSLAFRRQRLHRWLGERVQSGADAPADVVFLSSSDRAELLGRRHYNTVVDPWAEAFAACGARVTVLSLGDPRWPTHVPHVSIQAAIDRDRARRAAAPIGPAPPWFEELAAWAADALEADLAWPNLAADLRATIAASALLESWLRRARPRLLVLDCWYRREALGAIVAARRLGIAVVDLQHGIQGQGHPCYAGWSATPGSGFETFPDRFWVWGEWDAASLVESNPGVIDRERVEVVGNRWLSGWVAGQDPRRRRALGAAERRVGLRRALLVTLQDAVSSGRELTALMQAAPRDWLWLVRLHRGSRSKPETVERALARATGRRVDAVSATRLPLHALMQAVSGHVTGFSTCALEALAFGVPTLLLHPSGVHAYESFVAEGVMKAHRTPEDSLAWLEHQEPGVAEACVRAAGPVFGELGDAAQLLAGGRE